MPWDVFERIYSGHWFFPSYAGPGFVHDFSRFGAGKHITRAIFVMEKGMCRYVFDSTEFAAAATFCANRLLNDAKWRSFLYKKIDFYTERYFKAGENLRRLPLPSLSHATLAQAINRTIVYQRYHQLYSTIANGVVLDGRNHFSNKIRQELAESMGQTDRFEEHWSLLTQVTEMSLRQQKDYAIARLAERAKRLPPEEVDIAIRLLHEKYCWLDYQYLGPPTSLEQFEHQLQVARRHNINRGLPAELQRLKGKQERLMQRLKFTARQRFLVKLAQHVIWQKGYRKDMQYHGFYCYEPYLRELAKRKRCRDWHGLFFLFPWEVSKFVLRGTPSVAELYERRRYSVFINTVKSSRLKIGSPARRFVRTLELVENFSHLNEVRGQCAYAGKARGVVKIIQVPDDMKKMEVGDILVSQATSPDLLPAMKAAGAIVTNTGGLICHAAITSRELKIPCVVGTARATLVFKDGDRVEVDATKGVVRRR